jgi:replicative DNA helicase
MMPAAATAEKAVVAAVLSSRGAALLQLDFLQPVHFYGRENRQVYDAALAIWEQGGKPDYVTVAEHTGLPRDAVLYYREYDEGRENIEEYGRLIQAKWLSRELVTLAQQLGAKALSEDPIEVLNDTELSIVKLRPQRGQGLQRTNTLGAVTLTDKPSVLPSGFQTIDTYTDGLGAGRFIILAARPSIGKTTLALNMAANVAKAGYKVAVYSMEMATQGLIEKLVLAEARVDADKVKDYRLYEDDILALGRALVEVDKWNLYLDDTSYLSVQEIATRAKRMRVEHGIDLLVVDYLQLIKPPKAENRVNEIAVITRELKALSLDMNIPIVALSQLNRSAEMGDGEPHIWQLRDSGTVEQDADQVILLWKDPKDPRNGPGSAMRFTHGKVGKNRWGREGPFELALLGAQSRFVEA